MVEGDGKTVELDFMEHVVELARERDMVVVHDFAYADLAFDGHRPPSILQVPGAKEIAIVFQEVPFHTSPSTIGPSA